MTRYQDMAVLHTGTLLIQEENRMKYPASLLLLSALVLVACAPAGPVRFYQGPPQPKENIAIVIIPAPITVRSIDGKKITSPSQESGSYELQLEPGHHLIAFQYYLYWEHGDNGMMVKSPDTGVDAVFEAGRTYEIRYKVPGDYNEAMNYFKRFSATLVDTGNGQVYSSYPIDNLDSLLAAKGIAAGTTATSAINTVPTAAVTAAPAATVTVPSATADKVMNEDPVKRLKFWWLMASEQERKQFTEWMKTATESFASPPGQAAAAAEPAKAPAGMPGK
jgi:uncharacterized protein YccT (UPF0319 family)